MQTVVGLYRTVDEANKAKKALLNEGYNDSEVRVIDRTQNDYGYADPGYVTERNIGSGVTGATGSGVPVTDTTARRVDENTNDEGIGTKIKNFFHGLGGHDDDYSHSAYTEGIRNGGALVAVNTTEERLDHAAEVLRYNGAADIDDRALYGESYDKTRATGEQVIPVVEEQLVVGKRQVERGGVRVFSRVVSDPISQNVNLHDERVVVDRRAVDRPATEADFNGINEPIEVRATGEEAVVGKSSRVVEEVVVGKTGDDRTETVRDSVRRTEVEVEELAGAGTRKSQNY